MIERGFGFRRRSRGGSAKASGVIKKLGALRNDATVKALLRLASSNFPIAIQ
jgi:hypothetical protein